MSSAEYVAKYTRRRALREKVERYWLEEAQRPFFLLSCKTCGLIGE